MDDVVVSTLCKGTVYVAEGDEPFFRHTGREGDGMSLGNTDIKGTVGHLLHHDAHRAACWHGRRDTDDAWVLLCQFQKCLAEDFLKFRGLVDGRLFQALTGFRIKLSWGMPDGSTFFRRFVTFSFYRMQVEQFRSLHVLDLSQNLYQFLHVMSVVRPEITDVHTFKDILLTGKCRLDGIVEPQDSFLAVLA